MTWKHWLGIGAACAASTQIGTSLKAVRWLLGAPEVAYSAQSKAEQVDSQFQQYLAQQDATMKAQQAAANAVNAYIQQQAQQQAPNQEARPMPPPPAPRVRTDTMPDGQVYCSDGQETWWPDQDGNC